MTELKIGDRVTVDLDSPNSSWHKAEGVVIGERFHGDCAKVRITKAGPNCAGHLGRERTLYNLTKLETPKFAKGDRVTVRGNAMGVAEGSTGVVILDQNSEYVVANIEGESARLHFLPKELELIKAVVPVLKVGDFVTFDNKTNPHWQGGRGRIVKIDDWVRVTLLEAPSSNFVYKAGNTVGVSAWELKLLKGNPFRTGDSVKTEGYNSEMWNNRPGVIDGLGIGRTSIVKFTDGKFPESGGFLSEYLVPRKPDVKLPEPVSYTTVPTVADYAAAKAEAVDGPAHYGGKDNPYEVIKVAEAWGFRKEAYLFNALKYLGRAGKKGNKVEDLKKLVFYVQREIALEEAKK